MGECKECCRKRALRKYYNNPQLYNERTLRSRKKNWDHYLEYARNSHKKDPKRYVLTVRLCGLRKGLAAYGVEVPHRKTYCTTKKLEIMVEKYRKQLKVLKGKSHV